MIKIKLYSIGHHRLNTVCCARGRAKNWLVGDKICFESEGIGPPFDVEVSLLAPFSSV